jgi:transcriptional regulator with XRE-family HTH domain
MSQAEFADRVGLPHKTMPDLESGNTPLSLKRLDAISKMLGISSPDLLEFIKGLEGTDYLLPPLARGSKIIPVSTDRTPRVEKVRDRSRRARR